MKFKHFNYPGNWFVKFWTYVNFRIKGYYIVQHPAEVPFYRQLDRKNHPYFLKSGTRCYVNQDQLLLELQGDAWFALGDSKAAKELNTTIQFWKNRAESEAHMLNEIRWQINEETQGFADKIIQAELDKAGVDLSVFKES